MFYVTSSLISMHAPNDKTNGFLNLYLLPVCLPIILNVMLKITIFLTMITVLQKKQKLQYNHLSI